MPSNAEICFCSSTQSRSIWLRALPGLPNRRCSLAAAKRRCRRRLGICRRDQSPRWTSWPHPPDLSNFSNVSFGPPRGAKASSRSSEHIPAPPSARRRAGRSAGNCTRGGGSVEARHVRHALVHHVRDPSSSRRRPCTGEGSSAGQSCSKRKRLKLEERSSSLRQRRFSCTVSLCRRGVRATEPARQTR